MASSVTLSKKVDLAEYESYETDTYIYIFDKGHPARMAESVNSFEVKDFERLAEYNAVIIIDKATKMVVKSRRF